MAEYIKLNDTVRFGIITSNPATGQTASADATPAWFAYKNDSDTIVTSGFFTLRSGLVGTYRANFVASAANGFASNDFIEVQASALVGGIYNRAIVRSFVIDDIVDTNVVQVSGVTVQVASDVYYANIKLTKDGINNQDEYTVQWFKNSTVLASGDITNAAVSAYTTNSNNSLFTNKVLNYFSINHGGLRYNETANLIASGEAYLVITSGTIDGFTRTWSNICGIDSIL